MLRSELGGHDKADQIYEQIGSGVEHRLWQEAHDQDFCGTRRGTTSKAATTIRPENIHRQYASHKILLYSVKTVLFRVWKRGYFRTT